MDEEAEDVTRYPTHCLGGEGDIKWGNLNCCCGGEECSFPWVSVTCDRCLIWLGSLFSFEFCGGQIFVALL